MKEIPLTQGKVALVDDSDFNFLSQWKWCAHWNGRAFYAARGVWENGKSRIIRMHQVLLDVPEGMEIDHRDSDGLNNTRGNIRLCSRAQNLQNQKKQHGTTSRFKGVSWLMARKKWMAYIRLNRKRLYLGLFPNQEDAALAYNEAALKYFGEFARLNVVRGET